MSLIICQEIIVFVWYVVHMNKMLKYFCNMNLRIQTNM